MAALKSPSSLSIDGKMLTPIVRRILNDTSAEVTDFQCQALTGGFEIATAIYQVNGNASLSSGALPWRVILKVIRPVAGQDDPQGFLYRPREALAYRSGMLYDLPGKLTAPRCYQVSEQPGGETWLWLEYIKDEVGKDWPVEHYGIVARQLGVFNGAYLTGCPIPSQPWIPRNWLRAYVENADLPIRFLQDNPDHPLVKSLFPGISRVLILMVWEERERLFKLLDALPQVFCHQDAFKGNLFSQHNRLVGVDWSYMGPAPVGAEIVPLVLASMAFSGFPVNQARQLDQVVFDGYLAGLADAGYHVPTRDVRLVFCLTLMLRYSIGAMIGQGIPVLLDQERFHQFEEKAGKTGDEFVKGTNELNGYAKSIFLEGMKMLGMGSLAGMAGRAVWRQVRRRAA